MWYISASHTEDNIFGIVHTFSAHVAAVMPWRIDNVDHGWMIIILRAPGVVTRLVRRPTAVVVSMVTVAVSVVLCVILCVRAASTALIQTLQLPVSVMVCRLKQRPSPTPSSLITLSRQFVCVSAKIYGRFAPSSVRSIDISPPRRFAPW